MSLDDCQLSSQPAISVSGSPSNGRKAAKAGAKMLMLMPPYHGTALRADETGILEQFDAVAEASGLPMTRR